MLGAQPVRADPKDLPADEEDVVPFVEAAASAGKIRPVEGATV